MKWSSRLLSLALVGFYLPAFTDIPFGASATLRWVLLGFLVIANLPNVTKAVRKIPIPVFIAVLGYCYYTLISTAWSETPFLTFAKAGANAAVCLGFFLAGINLSVDELRERFKSLTVVHAVFLVTSALTIFSAGAYNDGRFQGLTINPNWLASAVTFTAPAYLFAWANPSGTDGRSWRWFVALIAADSGIIALTQSRAAGVMFVIEILGLLMSLAPTKRWLILVASPPIVLLLILMFGQTINTGVQTYVYHGHDIVLQSRADIWDISLEKAAAGGLLGFGYGISVGDTTGWNGALTTVGLTREKGSSQLAILEELGVVGFGLYLMLMLSIVVAIMSSPVSGTMRYPFVAFVIGMIAHSAFESYFTAPGASETVTFWLTVGLMFGSLSAGRDKVKAQLSRLELSGQHG